MIFILLITLAHARADWREINSALVVGADIESGNHTLASAEARCLHLKGCVAFCFKSAVPDPGNVSVKVFFKSAVNLNGDQQWWTYLPPKPEFRFANTFADHMVLQQAPSRSVVWGFAVAGAPVNVTSSVGGSAATVAGPDGIWRVSLSPVKASETAVSLVATTVGHDAITLTDVLYGDVWFCSGQSNMAFTVGMAFNASAEMAAAANYPHVRLMQSGAATSNVTLDEVQS